MPTECSAQSLDFGAVENRRVEAAFDAGLVTSDAGALLLGATDRAIRMMDRFALCFHDERRPEYIEHEVATLVGQRVFGIALGYEDLNDHDELRHDPMMAILAGKVTGRREDCAPVAGKSTLNRLELSKLAPTRYHKISHNPVAIKNLLVDLFVEAQEREPRQIILDLDATDDPLHGEQEGRFFHAYYDCYCYLPLYVFCGRHLLVAKLRSAAMDAAAGVIEEVARVVAHIRRQWPRVRILLRADSGFAREDLMAWCEANGVDFLFGLAKNERLIAEIIPSLIWSPPRADAPAGWSAASRASCGRRAGPGADGAGSWPRPSGRKEKPIPVSWSPRSDATSAKPSTYTRSSTVRAATWRTGSRNASSTSMPTAPRAPPCGPINCACGLPPWPTCCSVHCVASVCMTPISPPRPAAPFVSSCSRSVRSCASAFAASKSPWHPPVRPPETGSAPPSGSRSPPWPAPHRHDTRRRDA